MAWGVVHGGFTGPKGKIGAGTEYHQDTKWRADRPEHGVLIFDALADKYRSIGRGVVFSNQGVHGVRYNRDLPYNEKIKLLERVAKAHSHSVHPGWNSADYFAVLPDKQGKFDINRQGAVEGATIFVAGPPGHKVVHGSDSGYGFFTNIVDPKTGEIIAKTGHGDVRRPLKENNYTIPSLNSTSETKPSNTSNTSSTNPQVASFPGHPGVRIIINNGYPGNNTSNKPKGPKDPSDYLSLYTNALFGGGDSNSDDSNSDSSSPYMAFMQKFLTETISKMFSGSNSNSSSNTG